MTPSMWRLQRQHLKHQLRQPRLDSAERGTQLPLELYDRSLVERREFTLKGALQLLINRFG